MRGWAAVKMRIAEKADLEAIGRTLAGAFEHDPLWGWAFEDAERERKLAALAEVFGFCAAAALGLGWVRVTDGVEAVALWIPPGSPEMSPADEERLPGLVAGACEPASAARVLDLFGAFEDNHPHEPPHFYLSLLGTDPDHAGHGHGLGLVADCLAEIDAGDPPAAAFLESSNPANVPRYERLGFRPTREVELIAGLGGTQMWRGLGGSSPPATHGRFDPGP
jgi:ribosomal protein S18 acetylase RimI-like enzyme